MGAAGARRVKRVHVARHAPEAHLVCGFLRSHGIPAEVRGDLLTGGWGELPVDLCGVWIADESKVSHAEALVRDYFAGAEASARSGETWACPCCGETLEGQFTACWNCGRQR
jgi:hypothetical protein